MAPRTQLQSLLSGMTGVSKVYFDPPVNVEIVYPCIIYKRDLSNTQHADNHPYRRTVRYLTTLIAREADHPAFDEIAALPMCTHSRSFTAGQLHHDVFDLFY